MDRLIVVKFHTNIANRWLFMIQIKIMAIILYSWSYFNMFRGPFFPDTVSYQITLLITFFGLYRKNVNSWRSKITRNMIKKNLKWRMEW